MASQRHPVQNGVVMFITTNTFYRKPIFANDAHARESVETFYRVQERYPFFLYGFVVMPDHCHLLLCVPEPGSISKIMNVYKTGVAFNIGLSSLWQPRFDMRFPEDPESALEYIHQNPVKAGLVEKAEDYRWSSASALWDVASLDECHPDVNRHMLPAARGRNGRSGLRQ